MLRGRRTSRAALSRVGGPDRERAARSNGSADADVSRCPISLRHRNDDRRERTRDCGRHAPTSPARLLDWAPREGQALIMLAVPRLSKLLIGAAMESRRQVHAEQQLHGADAPDVLRAAWDDELVRCAQLIAPGKAELIDGDEVAQRVRAKYAVAHLTPRP